MTGPVGNPDRRRAYRAFKAATQFGVLYAHASRMVYDDLVDDGRHRAPLSASQALEMKQAVLQAQPGAQAVIVALVEGEWRDVYGRCPEEVLRQFKDNPSPYRRLDEVFR